MLRDAGGDFRLGAEKSGASPRGGVSARATDGAGQESARALTFSQGGGQAMIVAQPVDLTRQSNGEMAISFRYRVGASPQAPVFLTSGAGAVDITALLTGGVGEWREAKVRLSCLAQAGANLSAVDQPWGLRTAAPFAITVENVRLAPNNGDAVCPSA
jgi:beta-glucosidase